MVLPNLMSGEIVRPGPSLATSFVLDPDGNNVEAVCHTFA
jgi:hypothetical protein